MAMGARLAALVLAAGRGERLRPLTDTCPKPLLVVQGKALMQWALESLATAGCPRAVINTAWLGEQIEAAFGNSWSSPDAARALAIAYSREGRDFGQALETAGGMARALPMLCPPGDYPDAFWGIAGDIFAPDFRYSSESVEVFLAGDKLAHLWLVANPVHNPLGDFGLEGHPDSTGPSLALNLAQNDPRPQFTFSTIGLYRKSLFQPPWCDIAWGNPYGQQARLAPLLRLAMDHALVSAELYTGRWTDVGTAQRLAALNQTPWNSA
jgi:MurNAc alpha-1-phosphate uridylyltransferase